MKIDVIVEAGLPAARVEQLAVQAERYGIQTLWVAAFPSRRDPVPALAFAARATSRIRLATLPVSPYEVHPLRIADQLLTLNELSNGRATILIGGLGHSVSSVTGLEPLRRVTAVKDTVQILKGLRPDQTLHHQGAMYSLVNYRADWATQSPPRIYAGATFEKMLRMAAGCADGSMLSDAPLGRLPQVMQWVEQGLARAGRSVRTFVSTTSWPGTSSVIARRARRGAAWLIWRGFLLPWFTETFLDADAVALVVEKKPAFAGIPLAFSTDRGRVPGPSSTHWWST
ncbi:MAG: LLM class flavin-dependent oxidoreductase [Steroidobacteraceae bacterium]